MALTTGNPPDAPVRRLSQEEVDDYKRGLDAAPSLSVRAKILKELGDKLAD